MNLFLGNGALLAVLKGMATQKIFPHAVLFSGENGLGKTTMAKFFAKLALCSGGQSPCGVCVNCRKIEIGVHPDLIFPERTGVLQSYNMATLRRIREEAFVRPSEAERKVFVLDDSDTMLPQAQNVILKVLEEPPPGTIFVLTAEKPGALLPTVRSRLQTFTLSPVEKCVLESFLTKKFPEACAEKISDAAEFSRGNVGNALAALETHDLPSTRTVCEEVLLALPLREDFALMRALAPCTDRAKLAALLRALTMCLRDAVVCKIVKNSQNFPKSVQTLARKLPSETLLALMEQVQKSTDLLAANLNINTLIANLCGEMTKVCLSVG